MHRSVLSTAFALVLLLPTPFSVKAANTHNGNTWFADADEITENNWRDPAEWERVWQATWVRWPATFGDNRNYTIKQVLNGGNTPTVKMPTVIFVHGCAGLLPGEIKRIDFFAANGYLVLSPISFARSKYPKSCSIFPKRANLYRGILPMRHLDIAYTVQQARELDWVDKNNIYLVGHSEGAGLVTTFNNPAAPVTARVAESWSCQSAWPEYRGINAPDGEPILILASRNDPWFRRLGLIGDCGPHINPSNGSLSIVYEDTITRGKHKVLDFKEVQQDVLNFLQHHKR